jgi:hypothetical protein
MRSRWAIESRSPAIAPETPQRSALGYRLTLADGRRFTIGDDRD